MKFLLLATALIVLCPNLSFGAIEEKISSTKSKIDTKKKEEREISKKLDQLARDISMEMKKLEKLKEDIKKTQKELANKKSKTKIKSSQLKKIEKLYQDLVKREEAVNHKIATILSKEIAITMIQDAGESDGEQNVFDQDSDTIIMKEILNHYNNILKEKFAKTKKRYLKLQKNRAIIKTELQKIKKRIQNLIQQREKLSKLKNLQHATIKNLNKKQKAYILKLARIKKEKQNLAQMLQKLKITKKRKAKTRIKPTKQKNINVRQIGSSYQKSAIAKYKGKKTIAPLRHYTITQKFGTFTDPIYKIKIFNDAIVLKSKHPNAKVRSVLGGKVVYAAKAPMLDYVVIMEHKNKIHTIYAHLSKIAPTIKVGQKIPKGYVIGKVRHSLTFEVTQNEKHINPTELIK